MSRAEFEARVRALKTASNIVEEHQLQGGAVQKALAGVDQDASIVSDFVKLFQAGLAHEGSSLSRSRPR